MGIIQNLFNKFWHQDTEKTFQPEGTYYDMLNKRVVQRTDGSFSVTSINGTKSNFSLPLDGFVPIGAISDKKDRLYVISCDYNDNGDTEIGYFTITVNQSTGAATAAYTAIAHYSSTGAVVSETLGYTTANPIAKISMEYIEESENIANIYFSDNNTKPKVINVFGDQWNIINASSGLEVGKYYMVTSGTVVYNGTTYGPQQAAGNVFTRASAANPSAITSGSGSVKAYNPPQNLNWNPDVDQMQFYASGFTTGSLVSGKYIFLSALENNDGYRTPWNYHTMPIFISPDTINSSSIKSYQDYQGGNTTENSGKGIVLTAENIDQDYDSIVVAVIQFSGDGTYEVPFITLRTSITASTMQLNITGNSRIENVAVTELISVLNIFEKVGTFSFNKNRMFAADVVINSPLLDYSPGEIGYSWFSYETPSDYYGHKYQGGTINDSWLGHNATGNSVNTGEIKGGQWYEVDGDASNYITYNGNIYYPGHANGAYFQGANDGSGKVETDFATTLGSPTVYPVIRIAKFKSGTSGTNPNTTSYKYYRIQNDFLDMKGMVTSQLLVGYKRGGEKYRIGIMGITNEGAVVPVVAPFDVVTPEITAGYPLTNNWKDATGSPTYEDTWGTMQLGLRIGTDSKPLDLSSVADKLSAIFIVRAPRKKRSVAQGYLDGCVYDSINSHYEPPASFMTTFNCGNVAAWPNVGMLYSPEFLFEDIDALNVGNAKLKYSAYLDGVRDTSGGNQNVNFGLHRGLAGTYTSIYPWMYHKVHDLTFPTGSKLGSEIDLVAIRPTTQDEATVNISGVTGNFSRTAYFKGNDNSDEFRGANITAKFTMLSSKVSDFASHALQWEGKPLVDILDPTNLNPDYGDVALTEYQLCGHVLPLTDAIRTENGGWSFKEIEVFGGDVYVNFFDYQKNVTTDYNVSAPTGHSGGATFGAGAYGICHQGLTVSFPVESVINVAFRSGRHGMKDGGRTSGLTNGVSETQPEDFTYYDSYTNEKAYTFGALDPDSDFSLIRKKSVFFTDVKIPGEAINSFRLWPAGNERYVEIRNGDITALRSKKGRLFCFQKNGVIYLPIEEAKIISGNVGDATVLGVGGVIDRYDESTERYGMQDRFSIGEFDNGWIFVDLVKRRMLYISITGEEVKMDLVKGVSNKLDDFLKTSGYENNLSSLNPFDQYGISSGYHERYREMYFCFKSPEGNLTIGVNEQAMAFVGRYSFSPSMFLEHGVRLFCSHEMNRTMSFDYTTGLSIPGMLFGFFYSGTKVIFEDSSGNHQAFKVINRYLITNLETQLLTVSNWVLLGDVNEIHDFDDPTASPVYLIGDANQELVEVIVNPDALHNKAFKAIRIDTGDGYGSGENDAYMHDKVYFSTGTRNSEKNAEDFVLNGAGEYRGSVGLDDNEIRMRGKYLSIKLWHNHSEGKITSGSNQYKESADGKKLKVVSLITTFKVNKKYAE